MKLTVLRNIFIFGTLFFFAVLVVLTVHTLREVDAKRTPDLTDAVVSGKRTWQHRNCNDCHTILGIGGYWAPDMTKVADTRDAQFLTAFLRDPQAVKPGTTMPNQRLSDDEVSDVVAFLTWVNGIDTNDWPPQPRFAPGATGGLSEGLLLFQQKTCSGCHRVGDQGSNGPGPDLSRIGNKTFEGFTSPADFLDKFLKDPKAVNPDSTMPAVPMTDAERQTLVEYLIGLK
jgi:nitric oxide reductase subunit C